MRILHTSDWHIGKSFGTVDDATREVLREARLEAINRLGQQAQTQGAAHVLVAGDVWDMGVPTERTLRAPVERMRRFPDLRWHLIPGNHDAHAGHASPWDRLLRTGLPPGIHLHLVPEPASIGDEGAWLIPAPLLRRHAAGDPTAAMDTAATPEGAIRIGLAHGSARGFGTEGEAHNLIAPDRPDRAGLAYLALGDWHGAQQVGARTWYSGTPEPDSFDVGGGGGGEALLVQVDGPRATPIVTKLPLGHFTWQRETATVSGEADLDVLEARLRALHPDPGRLLLALRVAGALSLTGRAAYEARIRDGVGSALRFLRLEDEALLLEPSAADLSALAGTGLVGAAAERLLPMLDGPDEARATLARLALQRLFVLHAREGSAPR